MYISTATGEPQFFGSHLEQDYEIDFDAISKVNYQAGTATRYLFRLTASVVVTTRNPHFVEVE
jgi:hypothetical protein